MRASRASSADSQSCRGKCSETLGGLYIRSTCRMMPISVPNSNTACIKYMSFWHNHHSSLCWLRHSFAATQCLDARDRIYAVCSMLSDDNIQEAIKPDYTKATIEVYQDATMSYLRRNLSGDIRILEDCRLHSGWDGPSWVPDWSYADGTDISLDDRGASGNILPSRKA